MMLQFRSFWNYKIPILLLLVCQLLAQLQGPPNSDNQVTTPPPTSDRKSSKVSEEQNQLFVDKPDILEGDKLREKLNEHFKTRGMRIKQITDEVDRIMETKKNIKKEDLTKAQIEAQNLYETALNIFNKTSGDKSVAYTILKRSADMGHKKAMAELAWAHLLGYYLELDIRYAKELFVALAEHGVPEAHMGLAFLYSVGVGFNVSQPKALLHYTLAALGGNSWAQMALGYRYSSGLTVPSNCETALEYYFKVAQKVAARITFAGGPAIHRVRLLDEIENPGQPEQDLVEYYQLMADKGDVQSAVGLGQLYYQGGRTTPPDHKRALEYFTQAANSGNAIGYAFLGKIYLEGSEFTKADNDTAFKYFKKAAEMGNPIGQTGLGIMYLQGRGVPKDSTKALNYFTQASDQGWVDGQLQLGNMYFTGEGVKIDLKLAMKYFNLASQSGHVLAYYNLGVMHALGLGMMRSCPAAVEFFKNVAERGRWSEKLMHAYQDYKAYHFDESFVKYALLAEMGYEVAQSNAAFLLDRNEIALFKERNEDLIRAFYYWKRAAAQGYSAAQVKLGDYYYYGLGTLIDYETAASLYRKASELQYNAQAMFNLGYMHEQGLGMKKDWHLAKRLYDLAAETNSDAKVPVALALMKLQFMLKMETLKNSPFKFIFHLDENIASNWDLYLITILTLLLGIIMYCRRPTLQQENQEERQQQQRDQAADQNN